MNLRLKAVLVVALATEATACTERFPLWEARVVPPVVALQTAWIGNSLGGGGARRPLPGRLMGLHAAGAGTVVVVGADPTSHGEHDALVLVDGVFARRLGGFGAGRAPGPGATGARGHIFVAIDQARPEDVAAAGFPAPGKTWRALRRFDNGGNPAPFAGGQGPDGTLLVVTEAPERLTGVAASGDKIFVAHTTAGGTVSVFDADASMRRTDLPVPAVGAIAAGVDGTFWAIEGAGAAIAIVARDAAGLATGTRLSAPDDVVNPIALALDPQGRLLVADGAPREQILVFEPTTQNARLLRTIGTAGGLAEAGGEVRSDRFVGLMAVAADDAGVIYAGMNLAGDRGARVVALGADGRALWDHATTVDNETAALDLDGGEVDIYTSAARFRVDWAQPPGQQARWAAWTLDERRHPDDPRRTRGGSGTNSRVLRMGGRRFVATWTIPDSVAIYRFDESGDIAAPVVVLGAAATNATGMDLPMASGALWRDADGDGRRSQSEYDAFDTFEAWGMFVDEEGGIWRGGYDAIEHLPNEGLDARGVPIYRAAQRIRFAMPAPFVRMQRFAYVPREDVAYIGGFTHERPNPWGSDAWVSLGSELIRYDGWRGRRALRWRTPLLKAPDWQHGPRGFAAAGARVFLDYINDTGVIVLDAANGLPRGRFLPGPEIGANFHAERSFMPLQAFRRSNGEYVLFAANPMQAHVALFRVPPDWRE